MEDLPDKAPRDILEKHLHERECFKFLEQSFDAGDRSQIPSILVKLTRVNVGFYEFLEEVFTESSISYGLSGLEKGFDSLKAKIDKISSEVNEMKKKFENLEIKLVESQSSEEEGSPDVYETKFSDVRCDRRGTFLYTFEGQVNARILSDFKPFECESGKFLVHKYVDKYELIFTHLGQVMGYFEIETDKELTFGTLIHFLKEKYSFNKLFII
uniref:Uncharacterized protein n=1 Tax=Watermelon virus A TaxID=1978413 RepID=A0A5B8TXI1_9VIRU|nr:hypothetical protein [Watermelon virus A]